MEKLRDHVTHHLCKSKTMSEPEIGLSTEMAPDRREMSNKGSGGGADPHFQCALAIWI